MSHHFLPFKFGYWSLWLSSIAETNEMRLSGKITKTYAFAGGVLLMLATRGSQVRMLCILEQWLSTFFCIGTHLKIC